MTFIARNNWILLLVATGLSLLLLLTQAQQDQLEPQALSALDTNTVSRIQLALGRPGQTALQLQKQNGQWQLLRPVQLEADALAINEILRLASSTSHRQFESQALDFSKLQLAPPLWRITLDDVVFEVGGREAISGRRYVRHAEQVHLIDDLNTARLDNNYADLVTRALLPSKTEITHLRLPDNQSGSRELSANEPGASALFKRWQQTQAQWLVRPSALDYQEVHSRVSVTLRNQNDDSYTVDFLIHQQSPQLQLIRPDLDLMYMLPGSAHQELLSLPDA